MVGHWCTYLSIRYDIVLRLLPLLTNHIRFSNVRNCYFLKCLQRGEYFRNSIVRNALAISFVSILPEKVMNLSWMNVKIANSRSPCISFHYEDAKEIYCRQIYERLCKMESWRDISGIARNLYTLQEDSYWCTQQIKYK